MSKLSWPVLIGALLRGQSLSEDETAWAMSEIMDGAATPAQIAGFGVALRAKGETAPEMTGLARAMLEHATPLSLPGQVTDLVGTGGDGHDTVNISTMATIVAAAAGIPMAKHGNRAASSSSGAADVLEALGVVIDLPPSAAAAVFAETGIVFLFAALYHPAYRHTAVPRRELGVPTAFNYLGPLTNPARPSAVAAGVADPRMGQVLAEVLASRGNSALVFHGGGV
jgi:anthranilate phosphoribosyltransferase